MKELNFEIIGPKGELNKGSLHEGETYTLWNEERKIQALLYMKDGKLVINFFPTDIKNHEKSL